MNRKNPTLSLSEDIAREVRASFDDFIAKRSTVFPTILSRMRRGGRARAKMLRPFLYLSVNNHRVKNRKYIFLSARFPDLIAQFTGKEAAIIGGPSELRLAMKLGMPFCFSGDLYAAAPDVLFQSEDTGPSRGAKRVIARWLKFFSQQERPCYLVTPTDTLPTGLLLGKIAAKCPGGRVVCVQHGLFNRGYEHDDIDGRNSDINLVYSAGQRQEMLRRLPNALVEVMGFPLDYRCVVPTSERPRIAILVGTGALEHMDIYDESLRIFRHLAGVLAGQGYDVRYRPHPTERPEHYGQSGLAIDVGPKAPLLAEEGTVFFGFTSTLLYEANLAGHVVVTLDDPRLPGYSIEPIGSWLSTRELEQAPKLLARDWTRLKARAMEVPSLLRTRFEGAVARAEVHLEAKAILPH